MRHQHLASEPDIHARFEKAAMTPRGTAWSRDWAVRTLVHLVLVRPLVFLTAGGIAAALAMAQAVPGWVEAYIESAAMDRELAAMTRLLNPAVTDPQTLLSPTSLQGAAGQWQQHFGDDPEGFGLRMWSSAGAPVYSSFPESTERWPPRSPELLAALGGRASVRIAMAAAHEPEEIVRIAEQHVQSSLEADFAALYLLRGQELERQGPTAPEGSPAALVLPTMPLLRGVMASGPVALVRPPGRWEFDQLADAPLWSVVAAPFALRPEVTGVLLAGRTFERPFPAEDVHGLQTVVALALFAFDNALAHRELQQRYRRAESWALQDPLTGLANYRAFHDRLEAELTLAAREGLPCALLVADIDQLQRVNERWGLAEGDRRLRETARLLAREGRRGDLAARYGGDEFGLILRGISLPDAISRASRLCQRARTAAPSGHDGNDNLDGLSVGVAVFPDHGSSKEELLAAAERAVAHAGREGGGRVSWPELDSATAAGAPSRPDAAVPASLGSVQATHARR